MVTKGHQEWDQSDHMHFLKLVVNDSYPNYKLLHFQDINPRYQMGQDLRPQIDITICRIHI